MGPPGQALGEPGQGAGCWPPQPQLGAPALRPSQHSLQARRDCPMTSRNKMKSNTPACRAAFASSKTNCWLESESVGNFSQCFSHFFFFSL
uniref:Uncharacterized protein n=1 Tax=Cairina moschata TaxID=8855 RepID=A0A8C3C8K5_CAIMO